MSDDAQNISRRDMMRLGAAGVAAAGIANLPVMADEKAASDKLPNTTPLKLLIVDLKVGKAGCSTHNRAEPSAVAVAAKRGGFPGR